MHGDKYTLSIKIRSFLATFFYYFKCSSLAFKIYNLFGYNLIILTYHRIIPSYLDQGKYDLGLCISPESFKEQIEILKDHFEFIDLGGFLPRLKSSSFSPKNKKPFCALTFDDGNYDLYKYVFPILKSYNIPATIFVPTDFIGTNNLPWWDKFRELLIQKDNIKIRNRLVQAPSKIYLVNQLERLSGSTLHKLQRGTELLRWHRSEGINEALEEFSVRWDLRVPHSERIFISWEEAREMKESGLVSFGSHSKTHRIFTTLTDAEVKMELIKSKEKLTSERLVDPTNIGFCYPNGIYNQKISKTVSDCGYNFAVTTNLGWNYLKSNYFSLRRIGVDKNITSTPALFSCRIAGIL